MLHRYLVVQYVSPTPGLVLENEAFINGKLVKAEKGKSEPRMTIARPRADHFALTERYTLSDGEVVAYSTTYTGVVHGKWVSKVLKAPRSSR